MPPQLIEQLFEAGLVVSALPYVLCFVSVRASEVDAAVRVGWKWQSVFSRVPMLIRDGARINLRARSRQIRFREPERAEVFAGGGCHRGEYQGTDQERDRENQWFKRSINHHHYFT